MSTLKEIFTSRAVMTALLGVATAIVGFYGWIPTEIWVPLVGLFAAIFLKFTTDDLGVTIGRTIARSLREDK